MDSTDAQSFEKNLSSLSVGSQSTDSECSLEDEKINLADTQPLENSCSPSPDGKVDFHFHKSDCSPNGKRNLSDIQSPIDDCTLQEYHYNSFTQAPGTDLSSLNEYYLTNALSTHGKRKLKDTDLSDSDSSSHSGVKHRFPGNESLKSDQLFPSTESISAESSDSDESPPRSRNELSWDILIESGRDCEKMLRQIIRTAYQFTRHSRREKLTLKDLEKAFKILKVDMGSDLFVDETDRDSPENEGKSQPITCTGRWLRKPEDTGLIK